MSASSLPQERKRRNLFLTTIPPFVGAVHLHCHSLLVLLQDLKYNKLWEPSLPLVKQNWCWMIQHVLLVRTIHPSSQAVNRILIHWKSAKWTTYMCYLGLPCIEQPLIKCFQIFFLENVILSTERLLSVAFFYGAGWWSHEGRICKDNEQCAPCPW